MSVKEENKPPSLPGPTPSLLSLCGFMSWSAWKGSLSTVVVLRNLAAGSPAKKSGKSYSETANFTKSRLCIAIVRATHLCIRRSCIPTSRMSQRPQRNMGSASACSTSLGGQQKDTFLSDSNKSRHRHEENSKYRVSGLTKQTKLPCGKHRPPQDLVPPGPTGYGVSRGDRKLLELQC
jgi:hypothetical protein